MTKPEPGFPGGIKPLTFLSGGWLLIMASDRLAHAVIVTVAMVWVFCFTSLIAFVSVRIFPLRGRTALLTFIGSFFTGIFLLLLWLFSPLCAMETFFTVSIVPLLCMGSGVYKESEAGDAMDIMYASAQEALSIGVPIMIFSLIREPVGYAALSLPGGSQGMVFLFSYDTESLLPIRLVTSSSGTLLLLGYFGGLYRKVRASRQLQGGEQ